MDTGNANELMKVTEQLSIKMRVQAKCLEYLPNGRCPWGRAGGEAGEGGVPAEGRLILSRGHCSHRKDHGKSCRSLRVTACALRSSPQTQSQCFKKVSTSLIWLKVARQTLTLVKEDLQKLNKEYLTSSQKVRTQGVINRLGTFWLDFAGCIHLLRSFRQFL